MTQQSDGVACSQISDHFPPAVRDALVAASRVPIPPGDAFARCKAIDAAIDMVRLMRPDLFAPVR